MNGFWQWFYSSHGVLLQISRKEKMGVFGLCVSMIIFTVGTISAFVMKNELMVFQFGCGGLFCGWVLQGLIAKDLSRQLKRAITSKQ